MTELNAEDFRAIARERAGEVIKLRGEIERLRELLTHAWNDGEVQNCEACGQWFRLEDTISMEEGGWICKDCAGSLGSVKDTGETVGPD